MHPLKTTWIVAVIILFVVGVYAFFPDTQQVIHSESVQVLNEQEGFGNETLALATNSISSTLDKSKEEEKKVVFTATHVQTPSPVKAIYMSSWVAGTPSFRNKLVDIIRTTEVNAVVIDIKDYTGKVSFLIDEDPFRKLESSENRIADIREFIAMLHREGVYVIGRLSVFQDPHLVKLWTEEAVKTKTDTSVVWKDHKGISWMDAGSTEVWDYVVKLARVSHDYGFDEINFDYIRFPSDGNMKDIYYPRSEGKVKSDVLRSFFEYLNTHLRKGEDPITISADIFGMTTTNTDDLNIGQLLEDALVNFDYVAPMVYPSHFPNNWYGMSKPAEEPYKVISLSMGKAVERAEALGVDPLKLRPWLQDFNLGATYTAAMVQDQIQATYDVGLDSWMLWDPKNIYTRGALIKNDTMTDVEKESL